jgi:8-oxo-dGTP diphosphatase
MKKVEVVAGIIYSNTEILCVQRGYSKLTYISKKFEFPGGKIEANETREAALKRELFEELEINPTVMDHYSTVIHNYPDFELTMHTYNCELEHRNIKLNEHISFRWLEPKNLLPLDWAEADLPIVNQLIKEHGFNN